MVSLKPAPSGWEDAIHDAAVQFMNAEVCFYEATETTPYNPVTGTGGPTGATVLWQGKARVQQIRSPRQFQEEYQANATRFFRFQLDPKDNLPAIEFGWKARVLDGARDPELERLVFVVNSAINSSHRAVRTVELSANMERVTWTWNPDIPSGSLFPATNQFPSTDLFPTGV